MSKRAVWTKGSSAFATKHGLSMGLIGLAVTSAGNLPTVPDDRGRLVASVPCGDLRIWFFEDATSRTICAIEGVQIECRREKRRFSSEGMALRARESRRGYDDYDPSLEPYYCQGINPETGRTCGFWHLGHSTNANRSNRYVRGEG